MAARAAPSADPRAAARGGLDAPARAPDDRGRPHRRSPAVTAPRLAACLILAAASAAAMQDLTPEEFLDLALGRTLTFVDDRTGELVGGETFLSRRETTWVRDDGSCARGRVFVSDGALCFDYDDAPGDEAPHCWHPYRDGLRLYVDGAGRGAGQVQRITAMTDEPLACGPPPTS